MAELAAQRPTVTGIDPTFTAASAGGDHVIPPVRGGRARLLIHVKNGDAAAHTVTIDDPRSGSPAGATAFDPDVAVSVPAGDERVILLDPLERFVGDDGRIDLAYSAATGMSVAVYALT